MTSERNPTRRNTTARHAGDGLICLQQALGRSIDVMAGYDRLVAKAELSIRPDLQALRAAHASQITRLSAMISAHGAGGLALEDGLHVVDEDDGGLVLARHGEGHVLRALETAELAVQAERDRAELADMRREIRELLKAAPGD